MKTLITITGASGAGKDTLMNALLQLDGCDELPQPNALTELFKNMCTKFVYKFRPLVSHTTRAKRPYEKDGKSYYFVSPKDFDKTHMVEIVTYAGNRYGLSANEINNIGDNEIGIVVVDPAGKTHIENYLKAVDDIRHISIFLEIDEATSRARMLARGDSNHSMIERLKQQREHNEYMPMKEYTMVLPSYNIGDYFKNVLTIINYIAEEMK